MKSLLSKLNLAASNFLSAADLANFRGGCNMQTCVNCCNTANGGYSNNNQGSCGQSCASNYNYNQCWSTCVQNICNQCYANFSSYPGGCYC